MIQAQLTSLPVSSSNLKLALFLHSSGSTNTVSELDTVGEAVIIVGDDDTEGDVDGASDKIEGDSVGDALGVPGGDEDGDSLGVPDGDED